jgi:hypothetical protein
MKTETQSQKVQLAMDFQLGHVISRYSRDSELSYEDAERHFFELRRFLALCAMNDGSDAGATYGMRGQIDEAWHTFLMFTRDYSEFCRVVAGRFLHHQPDLDAESRSNTGAGYQRFLADYERVFHDSAPADLWPRPFTRTDAGGPCGGCSSCGSEDGPSMKLVEYGNCDGCNSCSPGNT